jgi:hypothetical protein
LSADIWRQYREDRRLGHGRTLLSADNSYEIRVFLELVCQLSEWSPLRRAACQIRDASPRLSVAEHQLSAASLEASLELIETLRPIVDRDWSDRGPDEALSLIVHASSKHDELYDDGVCWAINLLAAFFTGHIGISRGSLPSPALLRRECFRVDRSENWKLRAISELIAASAASSVNDVREILASVTAFGDAFPALRRHSRLKSAFLALVGIGELSPGRLGSLIGCSEPGARKMLYQLAKARLATPLPSSAGFAALSKAPRLSKPWLERVGMVDGAGVAAFEFDE